MLTILTFRHLYTLVSSIMEVNISQLVGHKMQVPIHLRLRQWIILLLIDFEGLSGMALVTRIPILDTIIS